MRPVCVPEREGCCRQRTPNAAIRKAEPVAAVAASCCFALSAEGTLPCGIPRTSVFVGSRWDARRGKRDGNSIAPITFSREIVDRYMHKTLVWLLDLRIQDLESLGCFRCVLCGLSGACREQNRFFGALCPQGRVCSACFLAVLCLSLSLSLLLFSYSTWSSRE
ncbi:unnamed protein product [Scytosiphon promiscuus]